MIHFERKPRLARGLAIVLAAASVAWAVWLIAVERSFDGEGPPSVALFSSVPPIAMLVLAGVAWSGSKRAR